MTKLLTDWKTLGTRLFPQLTEISEAAKEAKRQAPRLMQGHAAKQAQDGANACIK